MISDLYRPIRFIITGTVINFISFIALKFYSILVEVNVRVTKIVLKSFVKVSSGLIITVKRTMIISIIYLPLDLNSSFLR